MGECFAYYLKFYIRTELSFSFIKELVDELIQMYEQIILNLNVVDEAFSSTFVPIPFPLVL